MVEIKPPTNMLGINNPFGQKKPERDYLILNTDTPTPEPKVDPPAVPATQPDKTDVAEAARSKPVVPKKPLNYDVIDFPSDMAQLTVTPDNIALFRMNERSLTYACLATVKFDRAGLILLAHAIINKEPKAINGIRGGWIEYRNQDTFDAFHLREAKSQRCPKVISAKRNVTIDLAHKIGEFFDVLI